MRTPERHYAAPLAALDRVVRLDGDGIVTRKAVAGNEPFFAGHYPDHPIYPGVFLIEAVQQAVRHYARSRRHPVRLMQIKSTRFLAPVSPGDVLETECRCAYADPRVLEVHALSRTDGGAVADIKLQYEVLEYEILD